MNDYVYIFTRQDMIPEQQAVQSAHATFFLGAQMAQLRGMGADFGNVQKVWSDPRETYFTLVGVRNLDALTGVMMILDKFGLKYETFFEPDIGNEPTSVAVYPIPEDERGPLLAFNLLKMGK